MGQISIRMYNCAGVNNLTMKKLPLKKSSQYDVILLGLTPCRLVGGDTNFFLGLTMETVCFSEILVSTYESTRRYNSEQHRHPHHHERQISHSSQVTNMHIEIVRDCRKLIKAPELISQ
jgi:hypothetical protein